MPVKIVKALDFELVPTDNSRLANLCGQFNEHLHQLESHFDVGIACRSNHFQIEGRDENQRAAMAAIKNLYDVAGREALTPSVVQLYLNESNGKSVTDLQQKDDQKRWSMKTSKATIRGRGKNQVDYLRQIRTNDLTLGIGPAGTGKTYLAVACAVNALENDEVQRLVLVRPAVEAGERLGFLRHSMLLLKDVEGIGITQFAAADVVRHPLVKKIVAVYEKDDPN